MFKALFLSTGDVSYRHLSPLDSPFATPVLGARTWLLFPLVKDSHWQSEFLEVIGEKKEDLQNG